MDVAVKASPVIKQDHTPDPNSRRVLLFNPPVYDMRFPWSRWQQPVTLLQLGTLLHGRQCDVRLVDALYVKPDVTLPRSRIDVFTRDESSINYWRYGVPKPKLDLQLRALAEAHWQPDEVYIEGFTTYWWEGAVEAVKSVRKWFPHAQVILYGAYPKFAVQHAADNSGADIVVRGQIQGLAGLSLDLSLYPLRPSFTYLAIGTEARSSSDIIDELVAKATPKNVQERISQFAFVDHDIVAKFPEQFRATLEAVIDRKLKVSFYALGNIHPRDLAEDPELASLLFRAGFKEITFADDRDLPLTNEARNQQLAYYELAIKHCIASGYKPRSKALSASICLGRQNENLEEEGAFMAALAHVAGSLIVVPYQPFPDECPEFSLERQNGKLFPLADRNGASYRIYQDFLGLAALLNTKYRDHTFDFLGDGLISDLVRSSLVSESWDPRANLNRAPERPIIIGWFDKEGRWVRS